jgi:hypothetical protein
MLTMQPRAMQPCMQLKQSTVSSYSSYSSYSYFRIPMDPHADHAPVQPCMQLKQSTVYSSYSSYSYCRIAVLPFLAPLITYMLAIALGSLLWLAERREGRSIKKLDESKKKLIKELKVGQRGWRAALQRLHTCTELCARAACSHSCRTTPSSLRC